MMKYSVFVLAAVICLVFFVQQLAPSVTGSLKLVSDDLVSRPYIIVTSVFVHAGVVHVLYNLFGLLLFGLILESIVGSRRFLLVFFVSGVFAGLAAAYFYPSALGASGAIFGVIGALAVLRPLMVVWVYYLPMPMFLATVLWALGDVVGFAIPSGVANAAHLAGLAAGLAFGFIYRGRKPFFGRRKGTSPALSRQEIYEWEEKFMAGK